MIESPQPLYVVKGSSWTADGREMPPKFWTGRTIESWPEYLSDPRRAFETSAEMARLAASAFNQRMEGMVWSVESSQSSPSKLN